MDILAVTLVTCCKADCRSTEKAASGFVGFFCFLYIYSNQTRTAVTKSTQPVGSVCEALTKHVRTESSKRFYMFLLFFATEAV